MSKKWLALLGVLIVLAIGSGILYGKVDKETKVINKIEVLPNRKDEIKDNIGAAVYIYTPNEKKFKLEKITFDIKDTTTKEIILGEVTKGIIDQLKLKKILPGDGIYTSTAYLDDRDLYLDLSSNIFENAKNPKEEMLILYSFINTFCNIEGIDRVKFLIDGKTASKVNFINITGFYKANMDI
ncbi:MAG: GerMN domain-containing protein [Cetobacterium sp.]|uniref:GerMN domain-containing protein n=1 Tax=Cetobacterium sp. TaxID=2071632 RepID=UPI003F2E8F02